MKFTLLDELQERLAETGKFLVECAIDQALDDAYLMAGGLE